MRIGAHKGRTLCNQECCFYPMDMMHVVSEEKETPRKKILNNGQDC